MKKLISFISSVSLLICLFCGNAAAANSQEFVEVDNSPELAIQIAKDWFYKNYSPVYDIIDEDFSITRTFDAQTTTNYTVSIYCQTALKAETIYDLPFVQGLYDNANAVSRSMSQSEAKAINDAISDYLKNIDFSHDYYVLTLDLVVPLKKSYSTNMARDTLPLDTLYCLNGFDTMWYPIEGAEIDAQKSYERGQQALSGIVESYADSQMYSARGYSDYDRIAARDYAWKWTGTKVTKCSRCGTSCKMLQDDSLWNNDEYPYSSNFLHNDCADFVSQCIRAGGIEPDPGKWERNKDKDNDWAWTSCGGLKDYMVGEGYWDSSDYAHANAGNIAIKESTPRHIVLITYNDTETHRYTGHTNDRNNYKFYESDLSGYTYYVIKST